MNIDLLVELKATIDGEVREGSGILISPDIVLTCWHVVKVLADGTSAAPVRVRLQGEIKSGNAPSSADRRARVIWPYEEPVSDLDFALLELVDRTASTRSTSAIRWAPLANVGRLPVQTIGYPDTAIDLRKNIRDCFDITGWVNLGSGFRKRQDEKGTFDIRLRAEDLPDGDAVLAWPSMSGAPVFAGRYLVGIVSMAGGGRSRHALRALPVSRLFERPDVAKCLEDAGHPKPVKGKLISDELASAMRDKSVLWGPGRLEELLKGPSRLGKPVLRDEVLANLLFGARARPGGVTAVLAPTGFGKSTLAAQLTDREQSVSAFFSETEQRDAGLAAFHLAFHSIVRGNLEYPDDDIGEVEPPHTRRWMEYASLAARSNELLIAVVDGIDEAAIPEDVLERLGLDADLPSNIHLFLLGRPGAWAESSLLKRELRRKVVLTERDQLPDLERFIEHSLTGLVADKNERARTIGLIASKARGSFLYVNYIFQDLIDKSANQDVNSWLQDIPDGLREYYDRYLWRKRVVELQESGGDDLEYILRVLMSVFEPASADFIAAIANHDGKKILTAHVLGAFRFRFERYLYWSRTGKKSGDETVSFNHASIGDFLKSKYRRQDLVHSAVAKYYRNRMLGSERIGRYGARYTARHILEAKGANAAIAFLQDETFILQCHSEDPSGSYYLSAIDEVITPLNAGEFSEEIALVLLRLGFLKGRAARSIAPDSAVLDWLLATSQCSQEAALSIVKQGDLSHFRAFLKHAHPSEKSELLEWFEESTGGGYSPHNNFKAAALVRHMEPGTEPDVLRRIAQMSGQDRLVPRLTFEVLLERDDLEFADMLLQSLADFGNTGDHLKDFLAGSAKDMSEAWLLWALDAAMALPECEPNRKYVLACIYSARPDIYLLEGAALLLAEACTGSGLIGSWLEPGPFAEVAGITASEILVAENRLPRWGRELAKWGETLSASVVELMIEQGRHSVYEEVAGCCPRWSRQTRDRIFSRLKSAGGLRYLEGAILVDPADDRGFPPTSFDRAVHELDDTVSPASLFEAVLRFGDARSFWTVLQWSFDRSRESDGRVSVSDLERFIENASRAAFKRFLNIDASSAFPLLENSSIYYRVRERLKEMPDEIPRSFLSYLKKTVDSGKGLQDDEMYFCLLSNDEELIRACLLGTSNWKLGESWSLYRALSPLSGEWWHRHTALIVSLLPHSVLSPLHWLEVLAKCNACPPAVQQQLQQQLATEIPSQLRSRLAPLSKHELLCTEDWRRGMLALVADGLIRLGELDGERLVSGFASSVVPSLYPDELSYRGWRNLAAARPADCERILRGICLSSYYHVGKIEWLPPIVAIMGQARFDVLAEEVWSCAAFRVVAPNKRFNLWAAVLNEVSPEILDRGLPIFLGDLETYSPSDGADCNLLAQYIGLIAQRMPNWALRRCYDAFRGGRLWLPVDRLATLALLAKCLDETGDRSLVNDAVSELSDYLRLRNADRSVVLHFFGLGIDDRLVEGLVDQMREIAPGKGYRADLISRLIDGFHTGSHAELLLKLRHEASVQPDLESWHSSLLGTTENAVGAAETTGSRQSGSSDPPENSATSVHHSLVAGMRPDLSAISEYQLVFVIKETVETWERLFGNNRLLAELADFAGLEDGGSTLQTV